MLDLTKDDGLAAVLSGDPVILRRFRSADTLLAFVESYARVPSTIVNVSGSILNSDGQTVARASAQPADAYASQERTSRGHLMTFDLSRVEPGDHVLTVTARSPSQPNQVITRQVRIAIDP